MTPVCSRTRGRDGNPASGPGLRRTAGPAPYLAGCRAGGSSAHTATVLTQGCRRQPDSAWVSSGKAEAATADTPKRSDQPVRSASSPRLERHGRAGQVSQGTSTQIAGEPHSTPEPFWSVRNDDLVKVQRDPGVRREC
jgi:hypothetical protein